MKVDLRTVTSLASLGLSASEIETLLKAQRTLHRWSEQECGASNDYTSWCIERDETTNKPFRVVYPHNGKSYRTPIADRETAALNKVRKIMTSHPELGFYHQGDCRGCSLYVGKLADIPEGKANQYYNRWIACC